MVVSSMLPSSSQPQDSSFPSCTFDHTYSKNIMAGSPPSAVTATMFLQPINSLKENGAQTEISESNEMDGGNNANRLDCYSNRQESEMLCDLDLGKFEKRRCIQQNFYAF